MHTHIKLGLLGLVFGTTLMGCHDDNSAPPSPPPSSSATSFEGLAFSLVEQSTCDTSAPVDINDVDFAFNEDQDTADPRELATVMTSCTT